MNICVYCASSDQISPEFFDAARELGALIAKNGHTLIFGGGSGGLMGAVGKGALENGGHVIGIAPKFFDEPGVLMKNEAEFIFTETMSERKAIMEEMADAFIALPGGIGTFEEFFEVLTLKQLGRHSKSISLLNTRDYYDDFNSMLILTAKRGFMSAACLDLYKMCATPEEALAHCLDVEANVGSIRKLTDYNK
ncbi:MAG: TIGR00730 family Rossman fold protein [Oscillospiraceae bacterium]|nr:TIGR00730 family Rossman fold protein [Oscillospiraceae bacterium]